MVIGGKTYGHSSNGQWAPCLEAADFTVVVHGKACQFPHAGRGAEKLCNGQASRSVPPLRLVPDHTNSR